MATNTTSSAKTHVSLRLPTSILESIDAHAEKEHISRTEAFVYYLQTGLEISDAQANEPSKDEVLLQSIQDDLTVIKALLQTQPGAATAPHPYTVPAVEIPEEPAQEEAVASEFTTSDEVEEPEETQEGEEDEDEGVTVSLKSEPEPDLAEEAEALAEEDYSTSDATSREESSTGNTTTLVFIICVVFIYLILCALYESLFIPIAVILSVPFGLAGSFLFAKMFGLENNIYLQTGLIMLIGLLSKTAILLTEYASERRRQGMSIMQAAISAAQVRLRPILMTSLTMIFGMLPMMFASGVGANGNISIGVGTVGGMLIGTVALLFIVPVLFIVFQYLQEKLMPARKLPKLEEENL